MHVSHSIIAALHILAIPLPKAARLSSTAFHFFEITAIVLGALGGGLAARRDRRSHFDFTGILGLGLISGVGGGITRDVMLGDGPPLSLLHPSYLAYAILGAALSLLVGRSLGPRSLYLMNVVDALSLGFFTVAGSTRAMNAGLGFLPCLLLGIVTAVGGGSLRDLFSGHSPRVFQEGELYALVSALSALLFLGVQRLGVPVDRAAIVGTVAGFGIRMLAVRYGWRTQRVGHLSDPVLVPTVLAVEDPAAHRTRNAR